MYIKQLEQMIEQTKSEIEKYKNEANVNYQIEQKILMLNSREQMYNSITADNSIRTSLMNELRKRQTGIEYNKMQRDTVIRIYIELISKTIPLELKQQIDIDQLFDVHTTYDIYNLELAIEKLIFKQMRIMERNDCKIGKEMSLVSHQQKYEKFLEHIKTLTKQMREFLLEVEKLS